VAAHLHALARWPGEPVEDGTPDGGLTQLAQLEALLDESAVDVRLVVVSIGGNDAGFADIGAACLAPGSCVALGARWLTRLAGVARKVERAYDAIRRTVGRDVPVLAVPYPQPIREESCPASLLDDDEHQFLAGFVGELNRAVAHAARNAGVHYLEGMEGALTGGLRICEGDEDEIGVNFLPLATVDGLTDQVVNPVNWIHNSLHPNERGHAAMAGALADWRAANPAPDALDPLTARQPFAPAELDEVMSPVPASYCGGPGDDPAFCGRDDQDWALTQVGLLLLYASIPAALVVAGCWLLWLELLPRTRPWWERRLGERSATR
jgi:lysophospholipase L1-like esterase